jgi:pyrroline-5-carboxylate reductase
MIGGLEDSIEGVLLLYLAAVLMTIIILRYSSRRTLFMITKNIGIIGCGVMGSIFAETWVGHGIIKPEQLFLFDRFEEKQNQLAEKPGVPKENLGSNWFASVDLLLFAVKPQDFPALAEECKVLLSPTVRIYSLMAGISVATLTDLLDKQDIVRFMPNTPSSIGEGVLGCYIPNETPEKIDEATALLSSVGEVIFLEQETMLHAVTAVSGSGPAWVYYFLRSLTSIAEELGFTAEDARKIVLQTVKGSVALASSSTLSFDEQITRVASKGGTTEAGLLALEERGAKDVLQSAVRAAFARSKEMAGGN